MRSTVFLALAVLFVSGCEDRRGPVDPSGEPRPELLWTVRGEPRAFIATGERAYLSFDGGVAAIDANTGSNLWEFPVQGGGRLSIPGMIVVDDKVLVRWSGVLHAFRGADGAELWRNEWGSGFGLLADGEGGVYVSAGNELARIDVATGEIRWRRELAGSGGLRLAAGQGIVCSSRSPIVTVACYDRADGALLWEVGQLAIGVGGVAILGGRFVVEVDDEWIGLDLEMGSEVWRRRESISLDRAARGNGILYACWVDCLALRATDGSILWRAAFENPSRPMAAEDFLFVMAGDANPTGTGRRVLVLDPASGNRVDVLEPREGDHFRRVLDYADGRLFLSTRDDVRAYRYP